MSIHHLRDTRLSLKAIGLFSIILSLPLKRKFYLNFVSFPPFPKMQAAQEMGVNLKQGYNGDLTSREAGSVGGPRPKKMWPVRSVKYDRQNRIAMGHVQTVQYIAAITV